MSELLELKKKAIEAEEAYYKVFDRLGEWDKVMDGYIDLANLLDLNLDIDEENRAFIRNIVSIEAALNRRLSDIEAEKNKLAFEYGLAKFGGKVGDVVDCIDNRGTKCAMVVEGFEMMEEDVLVHGTRFLKSGRLGQLKSSFSLEKSKWQLR